MTSTDTLGPAGINVAADLLAGVLGEDWVASALAGQLTCREADNIAMGLAMLNRVEAAATFLANHAESDSPENDDRHSALVGHGEAIDYLMEIVRDASA